MEGERLWFLSAGWSWFLLLEVSLVVDWDVSRSTLRTHWDPGVGGWHLGSLLWREIWSELGQYLFGNPDSFHVRSFLLRKSWSVQGLYCSFSAHLLTFYGLQGSHNPH